IWASRQIIVEEINLSMGISHGSIHAIVTKHLLYHKICVQWVPHQLMEEQKTQRMAVSLGHLQWYHEEEYAFLSHIAAGDKTWCPHFEPQSKRQSQQWKHVNSPPPKKSKAVCTSSGKVMMTFFFDCKGPLLVKFLDRGATISPQCYEDTLQKLRCAIKSKRPGMLPNGINLLHDNARPHTANSVRNTVQRFGWEVLQHPPYSPDLSPCDFHIFGDLKRDILGHWFASDEDVCGWVKM
ncbi:hypothetical protein B7P43_G02687, partial [Cryptotermes secundus]